MKYGESTFDILYLVFAVSFGVIMLRDAKNSVQKDMGLAALILGLGDAFHLVPRVMDHFSDLDLTAPLGVGKLVTSLTMTVFYVLLYRIWLKFYGEKEDQKQKTLILALAAARVILCMFPQNGWVTNSSGMTWGIIRNVPFVILGAMICAMYHKNRGKDADLKSMWLLILLSFLFYIPVAVFAGLVPMLGMLMLPKTVCYVLMILAFRRTFGKAGR
ncbi:MAG: hypothetical protein II499_05355 [Firmicutes bacterium]|nr:hypothetical protein [Bacillota bacterium]